MRDSEGISTEDYSLADEEGISKFASFMEDEDVEKKLRDYVMVSGMITAYFLIALLGVI